MQHFILSSIEQVEEFFAFYNDNKRDITLVSFDLETDSVEEATANIYGVGLSFQEDEGFYIPVRNKGGELFFGPIHTPAILTKISMLLAESKLIGHNLVYDVATWFHSTGVNLADNVFADTILMKHTLDEEPPFGLKEISVLELGEGADLAQQQLYENIKLNGGSTTKTNMQMFKADTEVLGLYCCHDVMLVYKLYNKFLPRLESEGLLNFFFEEEVMPLYREVTIPMKLRGTSVDTELLTKMSSQATTDVSELETQIYTELFPLIKDYEDTYLQENFPVKTTGNFPKAYARVIGMGDVTSLSKKAVEALVPTNDEQREFKDWLQGKISQLTGPVRQTQQYMFEVKNGHSNIFNLASKAHLKWLFFERLNLDPLSKTDKGEPQVDDTFLESVCKEFPWVNKLRDLNTIHKMQGTYIDGILDRTVNGKIHTSFLQFGTTSGRFASRNPNLQNCPAPQDTGSVVDKYVNCVRKSIKARSGYKLIGADFSSLEPHIAAYVSGDPGLIDIFVTGKDFYSAIAIKQFNLKGMSAFKDDANYLGNINKDLRNKTKTYCFTGSTFISTPQGYKYIKDLVIGDEVNTAQGPRIVTNTFSRKAKTLGFVTNKGAFTCTPDHKIWNKTLNRFVEASEFSVGDEVEVEKLESIHNTSFELSMYSTTAFGNSGGLFQFGKLEINTDWGYIIGAFLGDGVAQYSVKYTRQRAGFSSNYSTGYIGICGLGEDGVLDNFENLLNKYGFFSSKDSKTKNLITKRFYGKELVVLFQNTFDLFKDQNNRTRKKLEVPAFIMNASLEIKLSFIAGLLDTDGYLKGHWKKKQSEVAWCSRSYEFAGQLSLLLRSIGVESSINLSWNKTYKKYYYIVRISSSGIYKLKQYNLDKYLVCPRKRKAILDAAVPARHTDIDYVGKFKLALESEEDTVYDITVADVHEFYANGIRVHNCLAVFYGASGYRVGETLGIPTEEAQELVDGYLRAFPRIGEFIKDSHYKAVTKGEVSTIFGRKRHLKKAKEIFDQYGYDILDAKWARRHGLSEERYTFKNLLNNAVNFQIQGTAGHVMNRAMLLTTRKFKELGLDAHIIMTIHDEQIIEVREDQTEKAAEVVKWSMENAVDLSPIKLKATPIVGDSYGDCK